MPKFIMGVWQGHDVSRFCAKTLPELDNQVERCEAIGATLYVHDSMRTWRPDLFDLPFAEPFGCAVGHTWIPKMHMMKAAVQKHGDVCWLDLDSRQVVERLPSDFWTLLRARGPASAKLRQFRKTRCPWRRESKRTLLWTACFYCRDAEIIQRAIHWLATGNKNTYYNEEVALARAIDDYDGGWKGLEYWRDNYEMPWCSTPGEVFKARADVFDCLRDSVWV